MYLSPLTEPAELDLTRGVRGGHDVHKRRGLERLPEVQWHLQVTDKNIKKKYFEHWI